QTMNRRRMLTSSGLGEPSSDGTRGSSAIPQMGQEPGASRTTSGSMGHVYSIFSMSSLLRRHVSRIEALVVDHRSVCRDASFSTCDRDADPRVVHILIGIHARQNAIGLDELIRLKGDVGR